MVQSVPTDEGATGGVVWAGELLHRGHVVHERLVVEGILVRLYPSLHRSDG